tara:strand:+ start:839 stop:1138 length:300 start_codon:yes stop_codon:yes gene_type:complete
LVPRRLDEHKVVGRRTTGAATPRTLSPNLGRAELCDARSGQRRAHRTAECLLRCLLATQVEQLADAVAELDHRRSVVEARHPHHVAQAVAAQPAQVAHH